MEAKPLHICLKDCNQIKGDKKVDAHYIYIYCYLKQQKYLSKVKY